VEGKALTPLRYYARVSSTEQDLRIQQAALQAAKCSIVTPRRRAAAAQRMLRVYALHVAPTLFGEWTLVREWGRIGSTGTVRLDWFDSESAAQSSRPQARPRERAAGISGGMRRFPSRPA
jgi:predicted DNA-binding WGR domain protein